MEIFGLYLCKELSTTYGNTIRDIGRNLKFVNSFSSYLIKPVSAEPNQILLFLSNSIA